MKEKIFNKMKEYGWNLGDSGTKDFDKVYNWHYELIEDLYSYFEKEECDFQKWASIKTNEQDTRDMVCFMSDFLRAINDVDKDIKEVI